MISVKAEAAFSIGGPAWLQRSHMTPDSSPSLQEQPQQPPLQSVIFYIFLRASFFPRSRFQFSSLIESSTSLLISRQQSLRRLLMPVRPSHCDLVRRSQHNTCICHPARNPSPTSRSQHHQQDSPSVSKTILSHNFFTCRGTPF